MRICIAVQARMKSERFPGKVLADLCGKPMAFRVYERCLESQLGDDIVLAAAPDPELVLFGKEWDMDVVLGAENDLIARYQRVIQTTHSDAVVIVTGDCPLVDPEVIDLVIATYIVQPDVLDYVTTSPPYTWPSGQDVSLVPAGTLDMLDRELTGVHREWVTTYLSLHKETFRTAMVSRHGPSLAHLRWMVDYPEDLAFVRRVYSAFTPSCETQQLLEMLPTHPWLVGVQRPVERYYNYVPEEYSI